MSGTNFQVGQKVVCLGMGERGMHGERLPVKGAIYMIRDIVPYDAGPAGLKLVEIINPPHYYCCDGRVVFGECTFSVNCFRPLCTTNIDVFLKMVQPKPVKVDA